MVTVIVPFVPGHLHPDTLQAVQYSGCYCRFVGLDPLDPGAYGRLIRQLWRSQVTVIVCEHDVIPTHEQLRTLHRCGHDWCSYSYDGALYPGGPMFGLVRLSGRLMADHPEAAEAALTTTEAERGWGRLCDDAREVRRRGSPWTATGERQWWAVDHAMARGLQIMGVTWVEHFPVVHHAHHGPPSGPT
jgi:hypothetical protein